MRAAEHTQDAAFRAEYLHHLNIGDVAGLKSDLQGRLAIDVRVLWALLQTKELTEEERRRAFRVLRLVAVQNEKYPVPAWSKDDELKAIFRAALAADPRHAEEIRAGDWSKPWWVK
jgi:hypothetical protein